MQSGSGFQRDRCIFGSLNFTCLEFINPYHLIITVDCIPHEPMIRELKVIQKKCGIKILLKVHVARHTFGVRCADAGIPVETTARLMGHTDIKTTKIYYKITNKRMDEDVKAIF